MQHASEGSLPIHRVRFDAPATLTFSGYAETFAMAVTSLSVHGVGCSGPEGLVLGDRLQLAFCLAPEEAPTDFPCEVIWVEPAEEGEALYGMRFVGLTPEREGRLGGLLAERGGHPTLDATAERQPTSALPAEDLDVAPHPAAEKWDIDQLATYGLEGTLDGSLRPHAGNGHRATDLDAAILEQSRRPQLNQLHLGGEDPLETVRGDCRLENGSTAAKLRRITQERSFWLGAALGLIVGAVLVAGTVKTARVASEGDDERAMVPVPRAPEATGP